MLKHTEKFSPDTTHNFTLLHQLAPEQLQILTEGTFVTELPTNILIIDALFGSGLSRPLEGWPAAFVRELNELENEKIAIDLPSGLLPRQPADAGYCGNQSCAYPEFSTVQTQFLHREATQYTGTVHLLDIGLSEQYIGTTPFPISYH